MTLRLRLLVAAEILHGGTGQEIAAVAVAASDSVLDSFAAGNPGCHGWDLNELDASLESNYPIILLSNY